MRGKKYKVEGIIPKLPEAEVLMSQGMTQDLAAKQIGVSTQTRIRWRKEYGCLWPATGPAPAARRGAVACCVNPQTRSSHGLFRGTIAEKDPRLQLLIEALADAEQGRLAAGHAAGRLVTTLPPAVWFDSGYALFTDDSAKR